MKYGQKQHGDASTVPAVGAEKTSVFLQMQVFAFNDM